MSKILKNKFEDKFVLAQLDYSQGCQYGQIAFTFEFKPQTRTFSVLGLNEDFDYENRYQKVKLKYHQLHFVYGYELKEEYLDDNNFLKKKVKKIALNMMDRIELEDMYFTETNSPFEKAKLINMPTISNVSEGHICMGDEVRLSDYDPEPRNVYKQIIKNSEELCGLFFTTSFEYKIQKRKKVFVGKKEFYNKINCSESIIQINKGKF